jgi:dTMP kinase
MALTLPPGRFITLEGGEGAGKSTQARLLADWIREQGLPVVTTREPGGAPGAEDIRSLLVTGEPGRWDPLSETLLHYAARREHMIRTVKPALAEGRWVVCDRFADSTVAYQGYGQGIGQDVIARIGKAVLGDFAPDLTIVLDVTPETRRARVAGRPGNEDRYERMDEAFHGRVREGFKAIAAGEPNRCAIISADATPDAVANRIREVIARRLDIGVQFDNSP